MTDSNFPYPPVLPPFYPDPFLNMDANLNSTKKTIEAASLRLESAKGPDLSEASGEQLLAENEKLRDELDDDCSDLIEILRLTTNQLKIVEADNEFLEAENAALEEGIE